MPAALPVRAGRARLLPQLPDGNREAQGRGRAPPSGSPRKAEGSTRERAGRTGKALPRAGRRCGGGHLAERRKGNGAAAIARGRFNHAIHARDLPPRGDRTRETH